MKIRLPIVGPSRKISLTFGQLWHLLQCSHPEVKPFVLLAGFASCRESEACARSWHDVGKDRVLQIRTQVRHPRKQEPYITEQMKNPQSRRSVPLPAGVLEELRGCGQVSDIWICSDEAGGFLWPRNVDKHLAVACRKAGLIKRDGNGEPLLEKKRPHNVVPLITAHELRHTFISLIENELEAPAQISADLAGKSGRGVTRDYSHSHMTQLSKWMERYWDEAKKQGSTYLTTEVCRQNA